MFSRQDIIEVELADTKQRLIDLEEATLKHVNNVNGLIESEMSRFDKVVTAIEKQMTSSTDTISGTLKKHVEETNKWKVDYEDISTKKI